MSQKRISPELLPSDDDLTFWQQCVKRAIVEIQKNWTPYKWGNIGNQDIEGDGKAGCTEEMLFRNKRVMRPNDPPASHCCGATMEAFMRAWKYFQDEDDAYEGEEDMSLAMMKTLYKYFFLIPDASKGRPMSEVLGGAANGLVKLGEHLEWLDVTRLSDPKEAKFGDFVQMQFEESGGSGHSVIALGPAKWKGNNVLHVWSSNVGYNQKWPHSAGNVPGHGPDYYRMNYTKNGFKRIFHIGRIESD